MCVREHYVKICSDFHELIAFLLADRNVSWKILSRLLLDHGQSKGCDFMYVLEQL